MYVADVTSSRRFVEISAFIHYNPEINLVKKTLKHEIGSFSDPIDG